MTKLICSFQIKGKKDDQLYIYPLPLLLPFRQWRHLLLLRVLVIDGLGDGVHDRQHHRRRRRVRDPHREEHGREHEPQHQSRLIFSYIFFIFPHFPMAMAVTEQNMNKQNEFKKISPVYLPFSY